MLFRISISVFMIETPRSSGEILAGVLPVVGPVDLLSEMIYRTSNFASDWNGGDSAR